MNILRKRKVSNLSYGRFQLIYLLFYDADVNISKWFFNAIKWVVSRDWGGSLMVW
jgi:hypothetical protein